MIDLARRAGVRHVVYTSVSDYGPAYRDVPFMRIKFGIEKYLEASGLGYVILRPTMTSSRPDVEIAYDVARDLRADARQLRGRSGGRARTGNG